MRLATSCTLYVLHVQEEREKQRDLEELRAEASVTQLRSNKYELAERLREAEGSLREQTEGWRREKSKTLSLMFSESRVITSKAINSYRLLVLLYGNTSIYW